MDVQKKWYEIKSLKAMNRRNILNVIISMIGIVIANIQLIECLLDFKSGEYREVIYSVIICLVIVSTNVLIFLNKKEADKNKTDLKELEEKNKNLLEVSDNIRCFKHDFNNIIQAIDGYIYLDDMKSLQVYFKSLFGECEHIKVVDALNCQVIDNPAIYGVLINKYKMAEEKNIKMNIDILMSLKDLNEKSYVISRMLGILIDNAIEATCECEEKVVNISFIYEQNRRAILIENTYANKDIDTNRIFEKNYTTKKDKGNTGLGLWKIHDILSKDTSFDLVTTKNDTMFKQKLEIYV